MDESDKKATTRTCILSIKIKFKKNPLFLGLYIYIKVGKRLIYRYMYVCANSEFFFLFCLASCIVF